jgi:hypothetical protein
VMDTKGDNRFSVTLENDIVRVTFHAGTKIDQIVILDAIKRENSLFGDKTCEDIWDFRGCTVDEKLIYDSLVQVVSFIANQNKTRGHEKTAILADQDFLFGMSRMFASLAERLPYTVRVFRTPEAAEVWLRDEAGG